MDKKLFSIPVFRGSKNNKTLIYTNFYKALLGLLHEKLFFIEYFADINFYPSGQEQVLRQEIRRIYLAEVQTYKEAWYRAINDKWLKIPQDFLYNRKYQYQDFLFSKQAREIGEFYEGEFITINEDFINKVQQSQTQAPKKQGSEFVLQKDFEFAPGDGIFFSTSNSGKDINSAFQKLRQKPRDYICMMVEQISYDINAAKNKVQTFVVYAEEDKLSAKDALQKSKRESRISEAIVQGVTDFIYNKKKDLVVPARNAVFVPRNTILNKWKI